jgi:uncharacterized protein YkwD
VLRTSWSRARRGFVGGRSHVVAFITTVACAALLPGCAADARRYRDLPPRSNTPPEAEMVRWINAERGAGGKNAPPLRLNPKLSAVALRHSEIMRDQTRRWGARAGATHHGHVGQRVSAAGYSFRLAAENVAYGRNASLRRLHDGLMRSSGHRRNILNPELREVGVGIVRDGEELFVTQVFGMR